MKKTLFLCGILTLTTTTALTAQHTSLIGIQVGVIQSHPVNSSSVQPANKFDPLYTLHFGANLRREFSNHYYWQVGLHYTRLGDHTLIVENLRWGSEFVTDANGQMVYVPDPSLPHALGKRRHFDFMALQIGAGYYVLNAERFRVGLMPFAKADFLIKSGVSLSERYDKEGWHFDEPNDMEGTRKFNISAGFAFSAEFLASDRLRLLLSPDIAYQILSAGQSGDEGLDHTNYLFAGLNLGVFYRLN